MTGHANNLVDDFTQEQKLYLEGFAAGSRLSLPVLGASTVAGPADIHQAAQDRFTAAGKTLSSEETAKRNKNGLDLWDQVLQHAAAGKFPRGTDVFLFKFQGLFHVAPAQDAFMCRLRFAAGIVGAYQMRGLARLAQDCAGGYVDVTTRANLQLRQIGPKNTVELLMGLAELGIINRGAEADNIRNITASPTAGIDAREIIDTRDLARRMNHHILNHRELYGLPRKFNIAFDGGGAVSCLQDTNDIGFVAVRVAPGRGVEPGVYFRMNLGGITGHKDFARDTGILLRADQCIAVADAVLRLFIDHGDRTDRKKARLKYILDEWGFEKFMAQVQARLDFELRKWPVHDCEASVRPSLHAHIGDHPQKQAGLRYLGVVLPVGRISAAQMIALADIAEKFGSGTIRLTVWQNLLISDIPHEHMPAARAAVEAAGLRTNASNLRAGLVACTGNAGCKYAASNTKAHALELADYVDQRLQLDQPINIHLTGCPHSCAQHYIGDIGLLATKVAVGDDLVEGYHLHVGGGYGDSRQIAREILRDVRAADLPAVVENLLRSYLELRQTPGESFGAFVGRQSAEQLRDMLLANLAIT